MDFADRLRELRLAKQMSQEELGKILHLAKQTISSYENRASYPSAEIEDRIADYFKVSVDYLRGRTDDPTPLGHVGIEREPLSRSDDPMSDLPEEARRSVEDFKRFIIEKYRKKPPEK